MAVKHAKNRPATSTSWKKGTSGNPAGRPPSDRALATALRAVVDPVEYARILWDLARGKNIGEEPSLPALKLIGERMEGNPYTQADPELLARLDALEVRLREVEHERGK